MGIRKKIKEKLNLTSGSTRIVFFFGKSVLKIPRIDRGFKGLTEGIKANQEEKHKWDNALWSGNSVIIEKLCPVEGISFFGVFLWMERADRILTDIEWKKWENLLKQEKYRSWWMDVTRNNCMMLDNQVVMVDYATHDNSKNGGTSGKLIILEPKI